MIYRIAVCDDEPEQAACLEALTKEWGKVSGAACEIECYPSAEALWFAYGGNSNFHILLLDVEMRNMTGIQLAKELRAAGYRAEIIFVTSHFEFISEGYEVDALHYLTKPVNGAKLFEVLDRAARKLTAEPAHVLISCDGDTVKLYESDILYAEASLHDTVIRTKSREYSIKENISAFSQRLSDDFFRIHRSYIVNLKSITRIGRRSITLEDGSEVPASRGKYDDINRAFIARN